MAPTFEGRLGTLYARPAEALAARDGPALDAVAADFATLAAHGLTDRDIAQRLVVSRRTVHNHLHRTYANLGIAGRRQLRSVLG